MKIEVLLDSLQLECKIRIKGAEQGRIITPFPTLLPGAATRMPQFKPREFFNY